MDGLKLAAGVSALLIAILGIVAGIVLLRWPLSGAVSLTLILTVFLVIEGVATILYALEHKREVSGRWGVMLVSGIIDLFLAGMIFAGLPGTAAWAIGLLIGILFTFYGGLGVGHASQDAMNRVWSVPIRVWPGFFPKLLRSIELMGTLAIAIILTTGLNWLGSAHGAIWPFTGTGPLAAIGALTARGPLDDEPYLQQPAPFIVIGAKPLEQGVPCVGRVPQGKAGRGPRIDPASRHVGARTRIVREILFEEPRGERHDMVQIRGAGIARRLRLARQFQPCALRKIGHRLEELHFLVLHEKTDDGAVRAASEAMVELFVGAHPERG
jgi:hypothetical protein